jgi:succinate-semialdehyde dehydrogenase/glutarate-semialdehyde dehydrogenase
MPASVDDPLYPDTQLFIDGAWTDAFDSSAFPVVNPATGETIAHAAEAGLPDLERATFAAHRAFRDWKRLPPLERSRILRSAAALIRERAERVATFITLEQGKPLFEAIAEVKVAADTIEWFAEEGRRAYGRIVPARDPAIQQLVVKEPVGPAVVLTPWNFPLNQATRKVAAALAAGCTIVIKPAQETPACVAELMRALQDAGLPAGVANMVNGDPAMISEHLIRHPMIRKLSFTGSTAVGKKLAALAGAHMKPVTMELGGHAPVLVFNDAPIDTAAEMMATAKFRNAGQICVSPTRFLIQRESYENFIDAFQAKAASLKMGSGLAHDTTMGPLSNQRRLDAMDVLVRDAVERGARLRMGGKRHGNSGYFFEPTVLTEVPVEARAMNEEPFGPLALFRPFDTFEDAVVEANRLPVGLAAFAFTRSAATISRLGASVETGMLSVNQNLLALPEVPFGGVQDSGYGSEGGTEALDAYLQTKLITVADFADA